MMKALGWFILLSLALWALSYGVAVLALLVGVVDDEAEFNQFVDRTALGAVVGLGVRAYFWLKEDIARGRER